MSETPDPSADLKPSDPNATTVLREPERARAWWRQDARLPYSTEPQAHLVRNMAYEIGVAIVSALSMLIVVFLAYGGSFRDVYTLTRAYAPTSSRVALVTVGDDALYLWDSENPHPERTSRAMLANVVRFLEAADADVVVLDYLLDGNTEEDVSLAEAARSHGRVVVAEAAHLSDPASGRRFSVAPAAAIDQTTTSGIANFQEERASLVSEERYVRSSPLLARVARVRTTGPFPSGIVGALQDDAAVLPSLALQAAWLAQHPGADPSSLQTMLQLSCGDTPLRCKLDWSDLGIPAAPTPPSSILEINFRGPEQGDGLPTIPASRILRAMGETALLEALGQPGTIVVPDDLRAAFEGKVVVVASSSTGAESDRFVTPFSFPVFVKPDMSGGRIHAQIIDTLLSGRHIRTIPTWLSWGMSLLLAVAVVRSRAMIRDDLHTLGWILVGGGLLASGITLFHLFDGLTLEAGAPLAGTLGTLFLVHLRGWAIEDSFDSTELDDHMETSP